MAWSFTAGSSMWLETGSCPITAVPFTLSAWGYSGSSTLGQCLVSIGNSDSANKRIGLLMSGDVAGDPVELFYGTTGGFSKSTSTSGYSTNTWHHVCGVVNSTTSRDVYLDGGNKGSETTSRTLDAPVRMGIGALPDSTPSSYMSGNIADAAIWNVALTLEEVEALADGCSPLFIRPASLVFYAPLWRDGPTDVIGAQTFTNNGGTSASDIHPRTFRPNRKKIRRFKPAAGGGATNLAWQLAGNRPALAGAGGLAG